MNKQSTTKEYIENVLKRNRFAVLATEGDGQPHVSLIAITPFASYHQLIFATYRNTLKYRNLSQNSRVALFIENENVNIPGPTDKVALTIIGQTREISISDREAAFQAHLRWHPELEIFMHSSDCALIMVLAHSYQIVNGIDDIRWITAQDLDAL